MSIPVAFYLFLQLLIPKVRQKIADNDMIKSIILLQSLLLIGCLSVVSSVYATHNRAGEITYRQVGPLTIEVTVTTYTKWSGPSQLADRPTLDVSWGDGTTSTVNRSNGVPDAQGIPQGVFVLADIKKNEYIALHTYSGPNPPGLPYIVSMGDPNRNNNILNINNGNSDPFEFYLQTEVFIFPTSIFGLNSSPILLEPPIDFGIVGQIFQHNPNGYDPDGDSVAYEMIAPMDGPNAIVPGHQLISDICPCGPQNQYTLDPTTGLFTWNAPQRAGLYNIAILVKSYRNGLYLGGLVRDIQIEIFNGQNTPPQIDSPEEICVEAGTLIEFDVVATDGDIPVQVCTLTATGGPLLLNNSPATFTNTMGISPVVSTFRWQTDCSHIQQQTWQIVFKARDTYFVSGNDASLATFKVLTIRVVGPPVQNLQSNVTSGQVALSWDSPYICDGSPGFLGFSVWRKEFCDNFIPDSCEVGGLAARGYTRLNIGSLVTVPVGGQYTYIDNTTQAGAIYSYRVLAEFATPIPNTNNFAGPISGRSSEQLCVQMAQDLPLMTNVDVELTDPTIGDILVRWARPRAIELDTNINQPPYRYELYRSNDMDGNAFQLAPIWISPTYNSYSALGDTISYYDLGALNTEGSPYSYRVMFVSNGDTLGFTTLASSVFLEVASNDQTNILSWSENVPWTNTQYVVFLESPTGSGSFVVLDTVVEQTYTHVGLNNGELYCYYIESIGTYGLGGFLDSLHNKSQIACASPLDTIPPCPPIAVAAVAGCERFNDDSNKEGRGLCEGFIIEAEFMSNLITWSRPPDSCSADLAMYRLYFAPNCNGEYELVAEFENLSDTSYIHQPNNGSLAGCYYVTALDSVEANGGGNESAPSAVVQVDNCPFYELPNVFTPNGDGDNDTYRPCLPYRFIATVDFKVYNKWGQMVFQTSNPAIEWDGRDMKSGELLAEDVYFYTCAVTQLCLECSPVKPLKGNIHIIRGGNQ